MTNRLWLIICGTVVIWMATIGALRANEGNYQNYIVGDRAAGMGGAAVALARSVDACYYNPAGLGLTEHSTISISANLYGWQSYSINNGLYPQENINTVSFVSIPSTFGTVYKIGPDTGFGLGAFVYNRSSMAEIAAYTQNKHFFKGTIDDQTLWVGPSLGHAIQPELTLGLGVYGVYRTFSSFQNVYMGSEKAAGVGSRDLKYNNLGALALLGAQYQPVENWNIGLTIQTPSVNLYGSGQFHADVVNIHETQGAIAEFLYADDMDSRNNIPAKMTLGLGWEKKKSGALGLDIAWHLANSYNRLEGTFENTSEPAIATYRNNPVVDINIGGEYYLDEFWLVRGGFFTSKSATPDVETASSDQTLQVDLYGITAAIGRETDKISMSLGINYVFGSGHDMGYDYDSNGNVVQSVVEAKEKQLYVFFSTAYIF